MKAKYPQFPKKYSDWWDAWLEEHAQKTPQGFVDFMPPKNGEPNSYYMQPKKMWDYTLALSPSELIRGDKQNIADRQPLDYPTNALNLLIQQGRSNPFGKPSVNLYANEKGSPMDTLGKDMYDIVDEYGDIPNELKSYVPREVQTHENEHYYQSLRSLNEPKFNSIEDREKPAKDAGSRYWDRLLEAYKNRKRSI